MSFEPIPDDCLPFSGDEQKLLDLLRGPKVGADGMIVGGVFDGMSPEQVIAEWDAYNRAFGE